LAAGELVNGQKELLNRFFQNAVDDGGYEAAQQANAATMSAIFEGLDATLPKGSVGKLTEAITKAQEEGKTYGWAEVAGFVKDTAVSEFKQSPEFKAMLIEARRDGRAAGERSKEVAQSGRTPGGGTLGSQSITDDELDNMTNEQLIAAGLA
jgi:hypothetical protein